MRFTPSLAVLVTLTVGASSTACGGDDDTDPGSSANTVDGPTAGSGGKKPSREVTCTDQSVSKLTLLDVPNTGVVRDEKKGGGTFETLIDATGGGLTPTQSYVYARFTDDGFKRVDISDEDAFESLDWDIALRRYIIRLNSGVSGPGDVTGARTRSDFESLSEVPDDLDYRTEQYFSENCDFQDDSSGLQAPLTALSSFWTYQMCVQMTHNVYVIALKEPKERHVKIEVLSYYTPENQRICDETGRVPMPSGAGNMRIRWAFLD